MKEFIQTCSRIFSKIQPCSGILRDTKVYWGIFRHYWSVWSHNQKHLELCVTLAYTTVPYSEPWLILNQCMFKSLSNMKNNHAYSETPGIIRIVYSRIFIHFLGYLGTFRDMHIQPHIQMLNKGDKGMPPCHFWKSKKIPWFWKERPWLWLYFEFPIQNVVLRENLGEKTPKCFHAGPLVLVFLTKCL